MGDRRRRTTMGAANQTFAQRLRTKIKGKRLKGDARNNEGPKRWPAQADGGGKPDAEAKRYAAGQDDEALDPAKLVAANISRARFALTKNGGEIISDCH